MKTRQGFSLMLSLWLLGVASWAHGDLVTEEIQYQVDGEDFTGYLAYDSAVEGERPGILLVHEWWGHNDYVRMRADMLAKLGYTAFALDMYGSGKLAEHPEQANEFMQAVMSQQDQAKKRFTAALALLREQSSVDGGQVAALGYCFGGAVVLAMAREGVDLDGVVSYHGMLATESPAQPGALEARILVFNGEADPMVPPEQVEGFRQEMDAAGADYRLYDYEGVVHGFTNPKATETGERFDLPLAYDADADADSWYRTQRFLEQLFD